MVFRVPAMKPADFVAAMREQGVLMGEIGNGNLRMVTHYQVTSGDITTTIEAARHLLKGLTERS